MMSILICMFRRTFNGKSRGGLNAIRCEIEMRAPNGRTSLVSGQLSCSYRIACQQLEQQTPIPILISQQHSSSPTYHLLQFFSIQHTTRNSRTHPQLPSSRLITAHKRTDRNTPSDRNLPRVNFSIHPI